jgi:hypothetical protein
VKLSCGNKPFSLTAVWHKAVRSRRSGVVLASAALLVVAGSGLISAYLASFAAAAGSTTTATSAQSATASPNPSPDPAPPPPPPPVPTTSSSTPPADKAVSTQTNPKRGAAHKAKKQTPAVDRAPKPFSHAPRDIPVYAASTKSPGVQLATAEVNPASNQIAPSAGAQLTYALLLALIGISLVLLAIAATPASAVAVVSARLAVRQTDIGFLGASILFGVGLAVALVLGLRALR